MQSPQKCAYVVLAVIAISGCGTKDESSTNAGKDRVEDSTKVSTGSQPDSSVAETKVPNERSLVTNASEVGTDKGILITSDNDLPEPAGRPNVEAAVEVSEPPSDRLVLQKLAAEGPAAAERIAPYLSSTDPETRKQASEILIGMGSAVVRDLKYELLKTSSERSRNEAGSREILETLGHIDPAGRESLVQILRCREYDASTRSMAAANLHRLLIAEPDKTKPQRAEIVNAILEHVRWATNEGEYWHEPWLFDTRRASLLVAELEPLLAIPEVRIAMLTEVRDSYDRQPNGIDSVGPSPDFEVALPFFARAALDSNSEFLEISKDGLSKVLRDRSISQLADLLAHEDEPVRRKAVSCLRIRLFEKNAQHEEVQIAILKLLSFVRAQQRDEAADGVKILTEIIPATPEAVRGFVRLSARLLSDVELAGKTVVERFRWRDVPLRVDASAELMARIANSEIAVLPLLAEDLQAAELVNREAAAQFAERLSLNGQLADEGAFRLLNIFRVAVVEDESATVRAVAAVILGRLRDSGAIVLLKRALKDPNANVAAAAAGAIAGAGTVSDFAEIIDGENPQLAVALIRRLAALGDQSMINRILELTQSSEPTVQAAAVHAIGELKAVEGQAALLSALRDGPPELRAPAAEGLGEIAALVPESELSEIARSLIAALESPDGELVEVIEASIAKLPPAVMPMLIDDLRKPSEIPRTNLLRVLVAHLLKHDDAASRKSLREVFPPDLSDNDNLWQDLGRLAADSGDVGLLSIVVNGPHADAGIEAAREILDLAEAQHENAIDMQIHVTQRLATWSHGLTGDARKEAVALLGHPNAAVEQVLTPLLAVCGDGDTEVAEAAASVIGELIDSARVSTGQIAERVFDTDVRVAIGAVRGMADSRKFPEVSLDSLRKAVRGVSVFEVRWEAAKRLLDMESERRLTLPTLLAAIQHSNPAIRREAAALAVQLEIGDPDIFLEILGLRADDWVGEADIIPFGGFNIWYDLHPILESGGANLQEPLYQAAMDGTYPACGNAVIALGMIGTEESLALTVKVLMSKDPRTRVKAVETLAKHPEIQTSIPYLVETALSDPVSAVRTVAQQALMAFEPLTLEQIDTAMKAAVHPERSHRIAAFRTMVCSGNKEAWDAFLANSAPAVRREAKRDFSERAADGFFQGRGIDITGLVRSWPAESSLQSRRAQWNPSGPFPIGAAAVSEPDPDEDIAKQLGELRNPNIELRREAARRLEEAAQFGLNMADEELVVTAFESLLNDADPQVQEVAAGAVTVWRLQPHRGVKALRRAVLLARNAAVQNRAALSLCVSPMPEHDVTIPVLRRLAVSPEEDERDFAIQLLAEFHDENSVQILADALANENVDSSTRKAVLEALMDMKWFDCKVLIRVLDQMDEEVELRTGLFDHDRVRIHGGRLDDDEYFLLDRLRLYLTEQAQLSPGIVVEAAQREPDSDLRYGLLMLVQSPEQINGVLRYLFAHPDQMARWWPVLSGTWAIRPLIQSIQENPKNPEWLEIRRTAAMALGHTAPKALEPLVLFALTDPDRSVRISAWDSIHRLALNYCHRSARVETMDENIGSPPQFADGDEWREIRDTASDLILKRLQRTDLEQDERAAIHQAFFSFGNDNWQVAPVWTDMLKSGDPGQRSVMIQRLGRTLDPRWIEVLQVYANDPDVSVAGVARAALRTHGVITLNGPIVNDNILAEDSIFGLNPRPAELVLRDALRIILRESPLGGEQRLEAWNVLIAALRDPSKEVRSVAAITVSSAIQTDLQPTAHVWVRGGMDDFDEIFVLRERWDVGSPLFERIDALRNTWETLDSDAQASVSSTLLRLGQPAIQSKSTYETGMTSERAIIRRQSAIGLALNYRAAPARYQSTVQAGITDADPVVRETCLLALIWGNDGTALESLLNWEVSEDSSFWLVDRKNGCLGKEWLRFVGGERRSSPGLNRFRPPNAPEFVGLFGADQFKSGISQKLEEYLRQRTVELLRFVSSDRPLVRRNAATVLGKVGSESDLAQLDQLLSDPDQNVQFATATALVYRGRLTGRSVSRLIGAWSQQLDLAATSLSGEFLSQLALVLKEGTPADQELSLRLLAQNDARNEYGKFGKIISIDNLADLGVCATIPLADQALSSSFIRVRVCAALWLLENDDVSNAIRDRAVDVLIGAFDDETLKDPKAFVEMDALGFAGSSGSNATLLESSIVGLSASGHLKAVKPLTALLTTSDPFVICAALEGLAKFGTDAREAEPEIRKCLDNAVLMVRLEARQALKEILASN